uniref:Secreted protein n=1 Tax=Romanomermis culicivorax TaxID=13658 RepID=A0A915JAK4_ROMCU
MNKRCTCFKTILETFVVVVHLVIHYAACPALAITSTTTISEPSMWLAVVRTQRTNTPKFSASSHPHPDLRNPLHSEQACSCSYDITLNYLQDMKHAENNSCTEMGGDARRAE